MKGIETEELWWRENLCRKPVTSVTMSQVVFAVRKRAFLLLRSHLKYLCTQSLIWLGTAAFTGSKPYNIAENFQPWKINSLVIENSPKLPTSSPLLIIIVFSLKVKCTSHQDLVWKPSWRHTCQLDQRLTHFPKTYFLHPYLFLYFPPVLSYSVNVFLELMVFQ